MIPVPSTTLRITDDVLVCGATSCPGSMLPTDGRFGCGPSKVRPEAVTRLVAAHLRLPPGVAGDAPVGDPLAPDRATGDH